MSTARRSAPILLAIIALLLAVLAPAAGAAGTTAQPEPGPLSPAFVEALHDPLVTLGLGRVPSPVELHVSAAAETVAARMAEPSSYDLRDRAVSPRSRTRTLRDLLGVRRHRFARVEAHAGRPRA